MERNVPNVRQNLHMNRKFEHIYGEATLSRNLSRDNLPDTPGVSKGVISPKQLCQGCDTDQQLVRVTEVKRSRIQSDGLDEKVEGRCYKTDPEHQEEPDVVSDYGGMFELARPILPRGVNDEDVNNQPRHEADHLCYRCGHRHAKEKFPCYISRPV